MTEATIIPHNMIRPSLLLRMTRHLHIEMSNHCAGPEKGCAVNM
jgi:hypothetical protein